MTRLRRAIAVAAGLLATSAAASRAQGLEALRAAIEDRIRASGAEAVGVYVRDLARPDSLLVGAALRFHAASMMKVPVMIQAFRDADERRLRLGERIPVVNTFRSIVDGSPYSLSLADDSDSSLYDRVGGRATIRELVDLMITVSSNLATNVLIGRVDAARAQRTALALGADSIQVRAASARSCREMVRVLERQRFNEGIPAGLPAGVRVAHKTGWITATHHDGGIVSGPDGRRYVLVVLTRGIPEEAASARLMADIAGLVHGAVAAR